MEPIARRRDKTQVQLQSLTEIWKGTWIQKGLEGHEPIAGK